MEQIDAHLGTTGSLFLQGAGGDAKASVIAKGRQRWRRGTWKDVEKAGTIWSPRHEVSAFVFADRSWVVAGNAWPLKNDVWYLEIPGLVFVTQPVIEELVTAQYSYKARADFNKSGRRIRYRLVDSPPWLTVDSETGLIRGTPDAVGDVVVTVEAYDEAGETARQTYTLHVLPIGQCAGQAKPATSKAEFSQEPTPNGGRLNIGAHGNTSEASKSKSRQSE